MLIKFVKPDPRAGMTARMDSSRGQALIDSGAAVKLKEDGAEEVAEAAAPAAPSADQSAPAPAPAAKTAKAKK